MRAAPHFPVHARWIRSVRRVALAVAALCATGCVNGLFFHPDHRVYLPAPAARFEDVFFSSSNGTRLHGWFVPAVGKPRGTVLHVHGNAQNLSAHYAFVNWMPAAGFNVFSFDYRGFGFSDGTPSRRGLRDDTAAALRYLASRPDVATNRIVVLAQSLGCAAALSALPDVPDAGVRAVVLDSGFYSYRSIVRDKIDLIPVLRWLRWPLALLIVSNGESPSETIAALPPGMPLLLLHGTADRVVPVHHATWLVDRAHDPKTLWVIPGGRHTDALGRRRGEYAKPLAEYLDGVLGPPEPGTDHLPN